MSFRRSCTLLAFTFSLLCLLVPANASLLDNNLPIHDPSRMVRDGNMWYIFATGNGIDIKYSPDKQHWYQGTTVCNNQDPYWAPDMWNHKIHSNYYLFYSQPTGPFGTKSARIGVAITPSLRNPVWTDLGTIIATSDATDFNTIDPAPYYDEATDRLWLSFGSWFGGIYIVELDPSNPTRIISAPKRIARGGIEASYLLYHDGWFYLFANWDFCCRGGLSNYKIVVGRSRSVLGPYLDKDGNDMDNYGGTMFMAGAGVEIGPGHFGEAHIDTPNQTNDEEVNAFTFHAYVPGTTGGPARLAERPIFWQTDGWPRVDFPAPIPAGNYRIRVGLDNLYVGVRNESTDPLTEAHFEQVDPSTNRPSMAWTFTPTSENYYVIQNAATGFYADLTNGIIGDGDLLREWWLVNFPTNYAQQWRVISLGNGAYEIQNVRSGRNFDDFAFITTPGNPIWLWDWLYGPNQVMYLEPVQ